MTMTKTIKGWTFALKHRVVLSGSAAATTEQKQLRGCIMILATIVVDPTLQNRSVKSPPESVKDKKCKIR